MPDKKLISIVSGCYNEEANILPLYERIVKVMDKFPYLSFEIILIDNSSSDNTVNVIRELAKEDKRLKAIVNVRNFGHIRSPYHALLQAKGDAVIGMASDLEDPPELIEDFINQWEAGYKVVVGVRRSSEETGLMKQFRGIYYSMISRIAGVDQIKNFTGFGLYDSQVMDILREIDDPYPYFRGLICELGFERAEVLFDKPVRQHGISKGTLAVYFDSALLGIVTQSKLPLRFATVFGVILAFLTTITGLLYLGYEIFTDGSGQLGFNLLAIGTLFVTSLLFVSLGLIGEYVGLLATHIVKRPMVVEKERINWGDND